MFSIAAQVSPTFPYTQQVAGAGRGAGPAAIRGMLFGVRPGPDPDRRTYREILYPAEPAELRATARATGPGLEAGPSPRGSTLVLPSPWTVAGELELEQLGLGLGGPRLYRGAPLPSHV